MSDIKGFSAQRGWSDSTLITLLVEYLEDSGTVEDAFTYLNGVADVEDELADEEAWVDEDEDDGDDGEGEANG